MIGHSVKGKGFRGCLNYNLNPVKEAQVIGGNMAGQTPRDLAAEFGQVRQLNQRVKSPCWHVSLSAVPGEKLSNDQWNEVADRYLDQMKLDRSQHQYVVIRHYDTKHQHVHIVANRVDYEGQANYLKWHKKDTKKATRYLERQLDYLQQTCKQSERQRDKLEQDYQLPDAEIKRGVIQGQYWRVQREQDQRLVSDLIQQQQLQGVIDEVLPQSVNPDDFRRRLAARGVEMRLRLDETEQPMGISYQLNGVALPGFALGHSYTWARVQERLQLQPQVQIAPNISQESVQTSLLPGVIDDSEPNARRQRRDLAADGSEHAIGGNIPEIEQDRVSIEKDRGENRTYPSDGVGAIAATTGSGIGESGLGNIEDFARRFRDLDRDLENLFDGLGQETASARRVESESDRDWPSFSQRAGNDSVSAPDLGAFDSDDARGIKSEQGVEHPSESLGESAAGVDPGERSALEPDSAGYPEIDDPLQPDPDVVERQTVESQDVGIGRSRIDSSFGVRERSRISNDSEFVTEADFGSDQWASEQSGDQSEKDAQSIEIDPSQKRLIAIANDLGDDALIGVQREMERYFKQAPKRPDYAQVQRHQDQLNRLTTDYQQLIAKRQQQQKTVDDLGPARSLFHPFGSPRQEVEAAELELNLTKGEIKKVTQKIKAVKRSLKTFEDPIKRYEDWSQSKRSHTMREISKMLQIPAVQERVSAIHETQKREQGLKMLQEWEAIAQKLGKSDAYGARIREITEDYRQGVPLSDRAKTALNQDMEAYRQSQKQVQRRSRGFSL